MFFSQEKEVTTVVPL